jgi:hypothetical protein
VNEDDTTTTTAVDRDALVERAITAMRSRREYRAGVAFGVPSDARDQHDEALVRAVLAAVLPAVRADARSVPVNDNGEGTTPRGLPEFIAAWMAHPDYPSETGGATFLAEKLAAHGWVSRA